MKTLLTVLMSFFFMFAGFAQVDSLHHQHEHPWCGSHSVLAKQRAQNEILNGTVNELDDHTIDWDYAARKVTIPVVVHVVYGDSSQIPSVEDINKQLQGLNDDYKAENWDSYKTDSAYQDLIADNRISFKLATVDPYGDSTSGITYTQTERDYFTIWDGVKFDATGGKDAWDSKRYLNIWVCKMGDVRGYAQFPGGPEATDGVVIDYRDWGPQEILYDADSVQHEVIARVLTHEVGHWLGLYHIWGDEFCGDDEIKDTPQQIGPHWYCPDEGEDVQSCGSDDMTCNYMDYLGFECMVMFTKDQKKRIWKTLTRHRKQFLKKSTQKLTE